MLRGRGMEGHPAGFVKLRLADQQARGPLIKLDIRDQRVAGCTWMQSGAGQQTEQRLMGQGSQGASWTQPSGFVKDAADVCRGEAIGVRMTGRHQERALRDLGLRQTRLQVDQKPAGDTQTRVVSGGPAANRRAAGPGHREVGTNRVEESLHDLRHGGGCMQGAVRGRVRQEEVAGRRGRATNAQIYQERFPHILRQREQAFGVRFTGADEEAPIGPVHIV
jgi:hypothetical protein